MGEEKEQSRRREEVKGKSPKINRVGKPHRTEQVTEHVLALAGNNANDNVAGDLVLYDTSSGRSTQLDRGDRATLTRFFDGSSVRELLLESAAVIGVPEEML